MNDSDRQHLTRCNWAEGDAADVIYHDQEWGVPVFDDRKLFEFLILESAQAGLSWRTILHKRENYRKAFADFDPEIVARFDEADVARLMQDSGIVRNQQKITSTIGNAQAFLAVQEEFEGFYLYLWDFVGGAPMQNHWQRMIDVPASTPESDALSQSLKRRGFKFVGTTICYAYMQAMGLVNDHLCSCFRHEEVASLDAEV